MKCKTVSLISIAFATMWLTGCASNVAMQESFWKDKNSKIIVATVKPPKPDIHNFGGQGLLDYAVTEIANQDLKNSVRSLDLHWYEEMPQQFASRLKEQGKYSILHSKNLGTITTTKDKINIVNENNGHLLLSFHLRAVGAKRNYIGGVVPTGGPEGYCVLVGELIDPKTKKVLWHHEATVTQRVEGPWDQPPHFPNFNKALNIAIAEAKDQVMSSFFSGH